MDRTHICMRATNPNDIMFTLQMTMKLDDWRSLRNMINHQWPGWELRDAIADLITKAEVQFETSK